MTRRQDAKLRMLHAVSHLLGHPDSAPALAHVPAFAEAAARLQGIPERLRRLQQAQNAPVTGVTRSKQDVRDRMTEAAVRTLAALTAYADVTGNFELRADASISPSELRRTRETDAAARVESILAAATRHAADLPAYGIRPEDLEDLEDALASFSDLIGRPRLAISHRRAATLTMPELLAEADAYLDRLDRLSSLLERDFAPFVRTYRATRLVPKESTRSTSPALDTAKDTDTAPTPARSATAPAPEGLQA